MQQCNIILCKVRGSFLVLLQTFSLQRLTCRYTSSKASCSISGKGEMPALMSLAGICGWLDGQHWQAGGAAAEGSRVPSARRSEGESSAAAAQC
jgi:hypothetical protein